MLTLDLPILVTVGADDKAYGRKVRVEPSQCNAEPWWMLSVLLSDIVNSSQNVNV